MTVYIHGTHVYINFLCVCMCVCVCAHAHVCVCVKIGREKEIAIHYIHYTCIFVTFYQYFSYTCPTKALSLVYLYC